MNFIDYIKNNYTIEDLYTISQHGCEGGINGMIYYSETTDIYNQYSEDIHEIIDTYTEEYGEFPQYIIEHFGSARLFKNAMVWLSAQIVAGDLLLAEEVA